MPNKKVEIESESVPVYDYLLEKMLYHEHTSVLPGTQVIRTIKREGSIRGGGGGGGSGISFRTADRVIAPVGYDGNADYYTTGSADDAKVRQAASDLATSGGTVLIMEGVYSWNSTVNLAQHVKIMGMGEATHLVLSQTATFFRFADGISTGHRIYNEISNIRFDGGAFINSTGINCGNFGQEYKILNNWFYNFGTGSSCVRTTTNKKFIIGHNIFGGSQNKIATAISLSTTGDVNIVANEFDEFSIGISGISEKTEIVGNNFYFGDTTFAGDTICINLGTVSTSFRQNIIAIGNTFADADYGIKLNNASIGGAIIQGNFFRNINNSAVYVRGNDINILDNYFQDICRTGSGNDNKGIYVDAGDNLTIERNNIYNSHTNMTYGIGLSDTTGSNVKVNKNNVTGASVSAIRIPNVERMILEDYFKTSGGLSYVDVTYGQFHDIAAGAVHGYRSTTLINPPTNSATEFRSNRFIAQIPESNTVNFTNGVPGGITAIVAEVRHLGSGNITNAQGLISTGINFTNDSHFDGGTIGSAQAAIFSAIQAGSVTVNGTITSGRALFVRDSNMGLGSLTLTTQVGIDINSLTSGQANIGLRIAAPSGGSGIGNYALQLSDVTGSQVGGITFGTDTTLYRSAANTLKTDDSVIINFGGSTVTPALSVTRLTGIDVGTATGIFVDVVNAGYVGNAIGIDLDNITGGGTNIALRVAAPSGGGANYAIQLSDTGGTSAGGLTFGTDTNLYRSAADTLKTDDSIIAKALALQAGGSSGNIVKVGGAIFDHYADANNSTTTETDLYSDTLPASMLATNGDKIFAQYGGQFVGDATSTQRLRAYFGGIQIFDTGALGIGITTAYWDLVITCIRESASIVRCTVALNTSFATLNSYATYTKVTGLTLTNTQILKITGTAAGATAASNQITATEGTVDFLPAA